MMDKILFKDKQLKMLLALKDSSQNWYLSTLAKQASSTYVHACNFVNACESLGIATSEKHGKIKTVKLTDKGYKLAELLESATSIIGNSVASNAKVAKAEAPEPQK
jgi:predicted transcriptional regulator